MTPLVNLSASRYEVKLEVPSVEGMSDIYLRFSSVSLFLFFLNSFSLSILGLVALGGTGRDDISMHFASRNFRPCWIIHGWLSSCPWRAPGLVTLYYTNPSNFFLCQFLFLFSFSLSFCLCLLSILFFASCVFYSIALIVSSSS